MTKDKLRNSSHLCIHANFSAMFSGQSDGVVVLRSEHSHVLLLHRRHAETGWNRHPLQRGHFLCQERRNAARFVCSLKCRGESSCLAVWDSCHGYLGHSKQPNEWMFWPLDGKIEQSYGVTLSWAHAPTALPAHAGPLYCSMYPFHCTVTVYTFTRLVASPPHKLHYT